MFKKANTDPDTQDPGQGPSPTAKPKPTFNKTYGSFCYRLVGRRSDESGGSEILADRLKQAGMDITPGMYQAETTITTIFGVIATTALSFLLFDIVLKTSNWYLYVLLIAGITFGAILTGFRSVVSSRITNRKEELDRELPFTLSELSVLASTGMSPIQLVRRMANRDHDQAMTLEFKRVVYRTDIEGKDLITALAETAKQSPSQMVRESFWDLANMIHQGGNLDEYLRSKSDDVLKLKRIEQKEFIERLSTFLDMYVSLVLVGVLMIAVGAFLINALGTTAAGLNADELLLLLTFGLVPVAVAMTVIMISIAYARAE